MVEDRGRHPAGAVASPLLANIYLHYVFDLWVRHWRNIMLPAILLSSAMPMTSSWDSKSGGSGAVSPRMEGPFAKVRTGVASGQDAPD